MPTELDLVNRTLAELGKPNVSSVNDSEAALYVQNKLTELFPEVLLEANWNWAVVYKEQSAYLSENFSEDYVYTYQLPGDFGQFWKFGANGLGQTQYAIIDGYLLCNSNPIAYYYIVNDASYSVLPPLVARALVLYVASKSALTLTENIQLTEYLTKEYETKMEDAQLQNNYQRQIVSAPHNDFDRILYV